MARTRKADPDEPAWITRYFAAQDASTPRTVHSDPRVAGGTYWCGYWRRQYTVLAMWSYLPAPGGQPWMTVQWEDGHETTHCTPWDEYRDHAVDADDEFSYARELQRQFSGNGSFHRAF